jgi:transcriptional regulator with XRE-family HTH domain
MTRPQGDGADVTAVFARRVREYRADRGWHLKHLAAASGLGISTLSRIENGREASLGAAGMIARGFGVPLAALLPDVGCGHCLDAPRRGFTCQECGTPGPAVAQ